MHPFKIALSVYNLEDALNNEGFASNEISEFKSLTSLELSLEISLSRSTSMRPFTQGAEWLQSASMHGLCERQLDKPSPKQTTQDSGISKASNLDNPNLLLEKLIQAGKTKEHN